MANKRPEDPIAYLATYLYNFASSNKPKENRDGTQVKQYKTICFHVSCGNTNGYVSFDCTRQFECTYLWRKSPSKFSLVRSQTMIV